jgi:3-oxoacyl-[acyl-carrier-protein] synthase-1
VDYINGQETTTTGDAKETRRISKALGRPSAKMPLVNATKSMIGPGLGASGSLESVATVLQLSDSFIHPSLNCEDFHPEVAELSTRVPPEAVTVSCNVALKTRFGFSDVNCCLVLDKWTNLR